MCSLGRFQSESDDFNVQPVWHQQSEQKKNNKVLHPINVLCNDDIPYIQINNILTSVIITYVICRSNDVYN